MLTRNAVVIVLIVLSLCRSMPGGRAQSVPGWQWTVSAGTPDTPLAARVDEQGQIHTVGHGGTDVYLHLYDSNGAILQSMKCTNAGPSFLDGAIDGGGNCYLTGQFTKNAQFGSIKLSDPAGVNAMFVVKYSPAGAALWALGSTGGAGVTGWAIVVDGAGNSYVTGEFSGSSATPSLQVMIGGVALNNYTLGESDAFLAKVDSNGKLLWATRFGDGEFRRCLTVATDKSGNSYIGDGMAQSVYKFNSSGTLVWTRSSKAGSLMAMATASGLTVDDQGNVTVGGTLLGTNTFGTTTLASQPMPLTLNFDLEVTRYDSAGNVLWACKDGGTNVEGAGRILADAAGNAYLLGSVDKTTTIGGSSITNGGGTAAAWYVAKCKNTGAFEWAVGTAQFSGSGHPSGVMAVSADGTLYFAGNSSGGTTPSSLSRLGLIDPPTISVQPASQTLVAGSRATLSVEASPALTLSYQWYLGASGDTKNPIIGATTNVYNTGALSQTTNFWVRVSNVAGHADSVTATITIPVIVPPQITSQPQSGIVVSGKTATLSVRASGTEPLIYQWYESRNGNYGPIGENTNSYTTQPLTNTSYFKVRVSNNAGLAESDEVVIRVVTPVQITQQPQSVAITNGQSVTLSVIATGPPMITYQWYLGETGDTNHMVAAGLMNTYTTPPLSATTRYWVLLWSEAGSLASQTAVLSLAQAHAEVGLTWAGGGQVQLRLNGPPGSKWALQSSADLKTWEAQGGLEGITLDGTGSTNITAQASPGNTRFYRAVQR